MAKGFVYLTAVIDWASRKVLAAKVAITLEACNAVDVLNEAFIHHGTPEVINTDQGSQFTAAEFVEAVKSRGCRLSMDGRLQRKMTQNSEHTRVTGWVFHLKIEEACSNGLSHL